MYTIHSHAAYTSTIIESVAHKKQVLGTMQTQGKITSTAEVAVAIRSKIAAHPEASVRHRELLPTGWLQTGFLGAYFGWRSAHTQQAKLRCEPGLKRVTVGRAHAVMITFKG